MKIRPIAAFVFAAALSFGIWTPAARAETPREAVQSARHILDVHQDQLAEYQRSGDQIAAQEMQRYIENDKTNLRNAVQQAYGDRASEYWRNNPDVEYARHVLDVHQQQLAEYQRTGDAYAYQETLRYIENDKASLRSALQSSRGWNPEAQEAQRVLDIHQSQLAEYERTGDRIAADEMRRYIENDKTNLRNALQDSWDGRGTSDRHDNGRRYAYGRREGWRNPWDRRSDRDGNSRGD